jgi:hypothetical protein
MTYSLVDLWTAHKDEGGKPLVYRVENRPGPCVPNCDRQAILTRIDIRT